MTRNILTGEETDTAFDNPNRVARPVNYTQMLRNAKAKKAFKEYQKQNRRELISNVGRGVQRAGSLFKGAGSTAVRLVKSGKERYEKTKAHQGILAKIRGFRNKSIYDKEQ